MYFSRKLISLFSMPKSSNNSELRPTLGIRIVEARAKKGINQSELAESLGVSQRVISHWERTPVALRSEQLSALADALDVTADYLIGREE